MSLMLAALLSTPDLGVEVIRSSSELAAARERSSDRIAVERLICEHATGRESWTLEGFCQVCAEAVEFACDWGYSGRGAINFRERLVCARCGFNNRTRFMAHLLRTGGAPEPTYLFEQVTPFFSWAESSLEGAVTGSEYLGPGIAPGSVVRGVRHEDALELSFADGSFGTLVSRDVFEHVADIDRCLAECARVLRPGGRLYLSIPFDGREDTLQRATVRDGRIVELQPARRHVNPIDPEGSLVFYDHGWDLLDRCRGAGFGDAYVLGYWSMLYGYLGDGLQLMFVAVRD